MPSRGCRTGFRGLFQEPSPPPSDPVRILRYPSRIRFLPRITRSFQPKTDEFYLVVDSQAGSVDIGSQQVVDDVLRSSRLKQFVGIVELGEDRVIGQESPQDVGESTGEFVEDGSFNVHVIIRIVASIM